MAEYLESSNNVKWWWLSQPKLQSRGLYKAELERGYEERVVKVWELTVKYGHVIYVEVGIGEENTGIKEFLEYIQNSLRYKQNTVWAQNKPIVKMTDPYPLYTI